jgi:hypothetical protein
MAACEPTRIFEGYRLEVCKAPAEFCGDSKDVFDDTLLQRIITCLRTVSEFLSKRIPVNARAMLTGAYFSPVQTFANLADQDLTIVYEACCRFRQAVHDLYAQNPLNVRCQAFDSFDHIPCTPPPTNPDFNRQQYLEQVRASIQSVGTLLFQYILDCVCGALLPSCDPDPCDDRLILACMTVRNDEIVKICNWSCRRYAGSFPAVNYWLSLVPILPLLRGLIERLCCSDWMRADDRPGNDRFSVLLDSIDPTGNMRASLAAGGFSLPNHYVDMISHLLGKFSLSGLAGVVPQQSINLTALVGSPLVDASAQLEQAGVAVHEQQIVDVGEIPAVAQLASSPFAAPGETVTLYALAGQVVGFGRYDTRLEVAALRGELEALRKQVIQLTPQ